MGKGEELSRDELDIGDLHLEFIRGDVGVNIEGENPVVDGANKDLHPRDGEEEEGEASPWLLKSQGRADSKGRVAGDALQWPQIVSLFSDHRHQREPPTPPPVVDTAELFSLLSAAVHSSSSRHYVELFSLLSAAAVQSCSSRHSRGS